MALVIPNLGGGLGNRLFQFAAAASAAEKWGRNVVFATKFIEDSTHSCPTTITEMFPSVPVLDDVSGIHHIDFSNDDVFTYVPFPDTPPSELPIRLKGFFQTERYFPSAGIRPDWASILGPFRTRIEARVAADSWFIHFRFGDYRGSPMHWWDLTKYYQKCLLAVPDGANLRVFSDEPALCREFIEAEVGSRLQVSWSTAKADVETLYEMSLCTGGAIVANSTFSWWGAYFARQRLRETGTTFRAYYPDWWGLGLPEPSDMIPSWGTVVATEWNPDLVTLRRKIESADSDFLMSLAQ